MGWNARKFVPWMIIIFFIAGTVCVRFSAAKGPPFVVALNDNPPKLDPQDQYDSESQKLIGQVCEGLYRYNYSSPEMESIPQLATAIGNFEGNSVIGYNYTVTLRDDVTFHDGTPFNASAVKWTFDRIMYFTVGLWENNVMIAKSAVSIESAPLFSYLGKSILNSTVIESEFIVRFVLNTAPGFFEKLLAFIATQIMLPDPGYVRGDKFSVFLGLDDQLIGTGPFELVNFELDNQIVFNAFEDYYLVRPSEYIKYMIYKIVPDANTRSQAILNYEIHWGDVDSAYDEEFAADQYLEEILVPASVVFFIVMKVDIIPQEVRKACSFAYNYTQTIEDICRGDALYLHTPIPDGMLYHNEGFTDEPYMNLTYAREVILSCPELSSNITLTGLTIENSTDEWRLVSESPSPLAWYNITGYFSGLGTYFYQLDDNLKNIGIRIDHYPTIMCWCDDHTHHYDSSKSPFYLGGWGPSFNDPIDMISPLYSSSGSANSFHLNDSELDALINETYFATDSTNPTREELFHDIQELMVTELVPSFYIYQRIRSITYNRLCLYDYSINEMKNTYGDFYWCNVSYYNPGGPVIPVDVFLWFFIIVGFISIIVTAIFIHINNALELRNEKNGSKLSCPQCMADLSEAIEPRFCAFCGGSLR